MNEFGLKQEVITKISDVFTRFPSVVTVLIYGSRAKGNFKHSSDIDLTLKGKDLDFTLLCEVSNELDDLLLPYSIDLSIYDQIENHDLVEHIDRKGAVFYQKAGS